MCWQGWLGSRSLYDLERIDGGRGWRLPGFKTTLSFPRDGVTLVTTYFLFVDNLSIN